MASPIVLAWGNPERFRVLSSRLLFSTSCCRCQATIRFLAMFRNNVLFMGARRETYICKKNRNLLTESSRYIVSHLLRRFLAIREIAVVESLHYAGDEQPRMSSVFLDRDHMHVFFSHLLRPLSAHQHLLQLVLAFVWTGCCRMHALAVGVFLENALQSAAFCYLLLGVALRSSRSEQPIDR